MHHEWLIAEGDWVVVRCMFRSMRHSFSPAEELAGWWNVCKVVESGPCDNHKASKVAQNTSVFRRCLRPAEDNDMAAGRPGVIFQAS